MNTVTRYVLQDKVMILQVRLCNHEDFLYDFKVLQFLLKSTKNSLSSTKVSKFYSIHF